MNWQYLTIRAILKSKLAKKKSQKSFRKMKHKIIRKMSQIKRIMTFPKNTGHN